MTTPNKPSTPGRPFKPATLSKTAKAPATPAKSGKPTGKVWKVTDVGNMNFHIPKGTVIAETHPDFKHMKETGGIAEE